MRSNLEGGGCFPTGRHYPGIAHLLRVTAQGLAEEFDSQSKVSDLRIVSIDTETTGRDPSTDRIVEVACVLWEGGQVVEKHDWLVHPGCPIPEDAAQVHGIRDDDVKDKPKFAEIAAQVMAQLKGRVPLAYNAEFDRNFLVAELGRAGVAEGNMPPAVRRAVEWIDPLTWARQLQREEKSKALGEVAARLGIEIQQAHRATDDAEAAIQVHARFLEDARVPALYGAFIQEQRRLARIFAEETAIWRNR
jgi:DNA polymerase-3 subunit epsilon